MAHISIYNGIIFIESTEESAKILGKIEYKKKGFLLFKSDKITLDTVKIQLVEKTIALGGNAVVGFTYGQKNMKWYEMTAEDSVKWYGEGFAAIISEERKKEIMEKFKQN